MTKQQEELLSLACRHNGTPIHSDMLPKSLAGEIYTELGYHLFELMTFDDMENVEKEPGTYDMFVIGPEHVIYIGPAKYEPNYHQQLIAGIVMVEQPDNHSGRLPLLYMCTDDMSDELHEWNIQHAALIRSKRQPNAN